MIKEIYDIELITPCYCAGANQKISEIRAATIRGKLRWWFRLLGGNPEQESLVFGSVHNETTHSSAVKVRVNKLESSAEKLDSPGGGSYLLHFLRANDRVNPINSGERYQIHILQTKNSDTKIQELINRAVACFFTIGTLGARSTRGLGSFYCEQFRANNANIETFIEQVGNWIPGLKCRLLDGPFRQSNILGIIEDELRAYRQQFPATRKSALGYVIRGSRQTSVVYFRPIKCGDRELKLLIFEAPHEKLLQGRYERVV